MEDLPNAFDLIIIGTGMPECILAAAASRVGKSVLHLDRNNYYGGEWASFNFDQLRNWVEGKKHHECLERVIEPSWLELTGEGEQLIPCSKDSVTITNVVEKLNVREKADVNCELASGDNFGAFKIVPPNNTVLDNNGSACDSEPATVQEVLPVTFDNSSANIENNTSAVGATTDSSQHLSQDSANNSVQEVGNVASLSTTQINEIDNDLAVQEPIESASSDAQITVDTDISVEGGENSPIDTAEESEHSTLQESASSSQKEWTLDDLQNKHRKFNIDIAPKLIFAKGPLVELLISSNIARYAEFKCFTRVLTLINGHLEQVPCSRADVFSTKSVGVVEKRMLMKLLKLCTEYQNHPQEYKGFEGRPFVQFLKSKKLTPNIEHYILHAIAMVDDNTPTLQGLQATQKFLESLGRYGNSPFLWTCYGSAELPQCFCRLCAVFGGIYHLKRDADAVILGVDNRCQGIISSGQRLNCQWLVMESSYAPLQFLPEESPGRLSRAVFITNGSILPAEKEQITLLRLPPIPNVRGAVTVLELGSSAYVCPDGLYIVHMMCQSSAATAFEDLESAAKELFQPFEKGNEETEREVMLKPEVLWCVFYSQKDTSAIDLNRKVPSGVLLTSSPDLEQDYENAVNQAKNLFNKICPGEEFLPRAPDPEDIVLEGNSNPGESHDNQLSNSSESNPEDNKIESQKEENDYLETKTDQLEEDNSNPEADHSSISSQA